MHLGLDLLFQRDLTVFQYLMDMRTQFPGFRIDDRKLLFDSESIDVIFRDHVIEQNERGRFSYLTNHLNLKLLLDRPPPRSSGNLISASRCYSSTGTDSGILIHLVMEPASAMKRLLTPGS